MTFAVMPPVIKLKSALELLALAVTALYALGYLSWVVHAWSRNLGVPPIFQPQYLGGGVVPAVILFSLYACSRLLSKLWGLMSSVDARHLKWGPRLFNFAAALMVLGFFAGEFREPLMFAGAMMALAASFFSRDGFDRILVKSAYWYVVASAAIFVSVVLYVYAVHLFAVIPIELGGGRPQCVSLDLDQRKVSVETVSLLNSNRVNDADRLIRTKPLWLLFDGGSYVILSADQPAGPPLRVRTDAIGAMLRETACPLPLHH
jgi:hypothetical protein